MTNINVKMCFRFLVAAKSEMRYGRAIFPISAGTNQMFCRSLAFLPHFPTSDINVQLTPARSQSMFSPMMEASTVWVEQKAKSGFTACVQATGAIKIYRVSSHQCSMTKLVLAITLVMTINIVFIIIVVMGF